MFIKLNIKWILLCISIFFLSCKNDSNQSLKNIEKELKANPETQNIIVEVNSKDEVILKGTSPSENGKIEAEHIVRHFLKSQNISNKINVED